MIEIPSQSEMKVLRRVPGSLNLATFLIALVEFAERFSYYGCTVVYQNFIFNTFWVYICPLLGAYIADTYLGRYKTILYAIFISLIGHILLVVSAVPDVIVHPDKSLAIFIIAIIIMGFGTGGFKPNISPLIAEQTNHVQSHIKILDKNQERVIVDPSLTAERIFMYFYLLINVGALTGQIGMVYAEKYVGFWLAYLLPTVLFLLCPIIMILGKNRYVLMKPEGSIFSKSLRLLKLATFKWIEERRNKVKRKTDPSGQNLKFWEAVKPSNLSEEKRPGWMDFDDSWVDEVRRGFKACKVFLWFPLYWLTYNQMNNNLTSQAGVMNTHGLPNDILSNLNPLSLIVLIPICDSFLYPSLRKAGINFTPIKKITLGFFFGSLSMVSAAILQHYIYKKSQCGNHAGDVNCAVVEINVWAQTPSYVLIALSEIFASVTGLEYAFTLAPKNMRSLVTSVFLFQSAIASAIGEAFNPLSSDPLLVWNYGTMATLAFIAGILFYFTNIKLDEEHDKLIQIGSSTLKQEGEIDQLEFSKFDDHHHHDKS